MLFNKHTRESADKVCFEKGYVNFDNFKSKLQSGDSTALFELESIMHRAMLDHSKGVERYYEGVNETD